MVNGTLYTYPDSFRGFKSQIAAKYSGSTLKVVNVGEDDKKHAKVPAFETDDKKVTLFESNAIAYFVSNEQLRGSNDQLKAEVVQWLEYGTSEILPAALSWVLPALSYVDFDKSNVDKAKEDLKKILTHLNTHLKTRTYLVGERITLADISVAADLLLAYQHVLDTKFREPFVNVTRWFTTVVNQPQFKQVTGDVKLSEKAVEYSAAKHTENKNKKPAAGGEKKEKKEKEKKPEKKAEAKPAAAPAAEEEEPEESYEESNSKDPFSEMPKGTFNMDEFKRTYSNKELSESLPYLWKNFDKENYSMWYCEYKYADELKQIFMTSNLIGGMYQRLEKLRKNAFASMCVWGEPNKNTIIGVWFWKGKELAFPLSTDWTTDYESFSWRKMNVDDENERKLANQVFSWEGEINGYKYADGKIFK